MAVKSKTAAEVAAETKQAAQTAARENTAEQKKEPVRYMYVGPTVPGIGIQNCVYTDIPADAMEVINGGHPVIADLFVQIRDYPTANRMIREKKGYIYNAYLRAEKIKVENAEKAEKAFSGGEREYTEERG